MEERHRGVPYPGTFLLDEDGVLVEKRFEQSHRIRPTANTLLRKLTGDGGSRPVVSAEASSPGVQVAAWLDTEVLYANQLQEIHIRFELDADAHLYTEPVPDGFRAVEVTVSGDDRLQTEPVRLPAGRQFKVSGLAERFSVLDGTVDLTIPFFLLSNRDTAGDLARSLTLAVEVGYQACTESECFMPERVTLELALSEEPNPGYETTDQAALSPLVLRRLVEGPKSEPELLQLVNASLHGVDVSASEVSEVLLVLQERGLVVAGQDRVWRESKSAG